MRSARTTERSSSRAGSMTTGTWLTPRSLRRMVTRGGTIAFYTYSVNAPAALAYTALSATSPAMSAMLVGRW